MEHTSEIFVDADPDDVGGVLADLSTYPLWNDVVATAEAIDGRGEPVWITTLRAQVGPFSRSKQLRMARTKYSVTDEAHEIRIERAEVDGRDHSEWVMTAHIEPNGAGSRVVLGLEYSGGLWNPGLDLVLGAAIDRATKNLATYLDRR